mgnify:FL=1
MTGLRTGQDTHYRDTGRVIDRGQLCDKLNQNKPSNGNEIRKSQVRATYGNTKGIAIPVKPGEQHIANTVI